MKSLVFFLKDICISRKMIISLAINDLRVKFSASFLGVMWAVLQPLVTILVLWFVFQVGLKNAPVSNVPFIVWLAPSYLLWNFITEAVMGSANSIMEYRYLVKKINFKVSIIPIIKIMSATYIHFAFILFIIFLNLVYGIGGSLYYLQCIYYLFATNMLLLGIGWLLAALVPFIPDVLSLANVGIQIGFWATPIVWDADAMSGVAKIIIELNPFYYVCQGYRETFTSNIWFWEKGWINIYYWLVVFFFFVLGTYVFRKMRPQFADVI